LRPEAHGSPKEPQNGAGIQPRRFFRNAPNRLLRRYFAARNLLSEVDFGALTETQVEPVCEAWLKLSDDARREMEQDFQDIDELATEGGSITILDEARWHGEDLAEQFASLTGFHEHVFWTFLERPKYWQGALAFHHAVPFSYWRKRKNVPGLTQLTPKFGLAPPRLGPFVPTQ
jgi:hypothetical protein